MRTTIPKTIETFIQKISCYVDCRRRKDGMIGVQLKSGFVGGDGQSFRTFNSVKEAREWLVGSQSESFHTKQMMRRIRREVGLS